MKKNFTFILYSLLCFHCAFAQQQDNDVKQIAEAEMKSAYAISNFTANMNTGNYNVVYQRLELQADPAIHFISGDVTTHYIAKEDMTQITFDLTNQLTVSAVKRNGIDLSFLQNENDELVITLPVTQPQGILDSLTVTYSGEPPFDSDAFVTSQHAGAPVLWTLSEPYGAKDWWPCKQDLIDKVDKLDVYITAPGEYISVSNGLEQSHNDNGDGTKTTHFKHNYPIPAYLIAIAVSNYSIYTQQAGTVPNTFPIVNYIYPETQEQSKQELAVTLPIMDLYEQLFETYPFHQEKYGHAQCGFGGGMEHTTVSFMGSFGRNLIAHELGHQWFGDKITCGSWKDIWLNEGFATYLSGIVIEHFDGKDAFKNWKAANINDITSQGGGYIYLTDADTLSVSRTFSSRLTYNKGAMVLNMLRFKMGDTAFYQAIKNYLSDPELAYSYAKTPQLQAHLEAASGMDLTEFFNDWVYKEGYPTYTIIVDNLNDGNVKILIKQTQSHPSVTYFEIPVPIQLNSANGQVHSVVLDNTTNEQVFIVPVPFTVASVAFDVDKNIISAGSTIKIVSEDFKPHLYPNPSNSILQAALSETTIVNETIFYNTLGKRVMETTNDTSWNISRLATGVYFVTLITNKGTTQLSFFKN
ncbi:M1 family aminopeptidase [Flavobacterium cerinum]|uniref:Aminopeptidase N n=1 Tax=Flavobacterium cerinum TaxID=2502784 RepID=A0A444HAP6_9FLAO|nr:M1 family aminopeptidase [Flavobacterium cerinum]RWX00246.1 T9SS type A sorting domain-containing protein [Flavobacterium cerinum]